MAEFFSRISKLVEQVKDLADDAGVLDGLKAGSGSDAAADAAAAVGHPSSADVVRQPGTRVGQPVEFDPNAFPPARAVADMLGVRIDSHYAFSDEEWLGTTFMFEGGYAEVRFCAAPLGEPYDEAAWWDFLTTEIADRNPVDIGEAAFCSGELTYVRAKGSVFHAAVYRDGIGVDAPAGTSLARLAADTL